MQIEQVFRSFEEKLKDEFQNIHFTGFREEIFELVDEIIKFFAHYFQRCG